MKKYVSSLFTYPPTGFRMHIHIMPHNVNADFVFEFGPEVFTFVVDVAWPLPQQIGETIFLSDCGNLTAVEVMSICSNNGSYNEPYPYTVNVCPSSGQKIDIATMHLLIYRRNWRWFDECGRIVTHTSK